MLRHLTLLAKAGRRPVAACALSLAAVFASAHAQTLALSDGVILLAQHTPNTSLPGPKMDPAALDVLLGQIEAFGFHLRNDPGGGIVSVTVYPVVLFLDRDALQDIT